MLVDRFGLAEIFGYSPDTIRVWVRQGLPVAQEPATGPGTTPDQRKRLFDTVAAYHWLLRRAMGPGAW